LHDIFAIFDTTRSNIFQAYINFLLKKFCSQAIQLGILGSRDHHSHGFAILVNPNWPMLSF